MSVENEFSAAFSAAFDATSSDFPGLLTECWPVNWEVCPPDILEEITPEAKAISEALAVQSLRMLTGFRVGGCPITVRPCKRDCVPGTWLTAPDPGLMFAGVYGSTFSPYIMNGQWLNACGCRNDDCSCTRVRQVILPGHAGRVDQVQVDGVVLPQAAYRVDNGNKLVRQDGEDWPVCQDMNLPNGEVGTFSVTYLDGNPVDGVGSYVAGLLAAEFARACVNADCSLPRNVQSVTRQGISMQMTPEEVDFPGGFTGIQTVDNWVRIWNPTATLPSGIYSPDARPARRTAWGA
jgi:hypothetical protein